MVKTRSVKKIIAREILILLFSIGVGILCFVSTLFYNLCKDYEAKKLDNNIASIQKVSDKLNNNFDYKQRNHVWYFESMSKEMNFDLSGGINTESKFWNYTIKANVFGKIDSVIVRWNGKWNKSGLTQHFKNVGFLSPQELNSFIIEKSISHNDSLNHNKSAILENRLGNLRDKLRRIYISKLAINEQEDFSYKSFVLATFFLFGIRYLYYLVRWCVITLKNN